MGVKMAKGEAAEAVGLQVGEVVRRGAASLSSPGDKLYVAVLAAAAAMGHAVGWYDAQMATAGRPVVEGEAVAFLVDELLKPMVAGVLAGAAPADIVAGMGRGQVMPERTDFRRARVGGPEMRAVGAVLNAVIASQEETGRFDLGWVMAVPMNALAHLLAVTDLSDAEIAAWADDLRNGLPPLVAGIREEGGSLILSAEPVDPVTH